MSYQLGVDVGTTYTSASVFVDGRADIVPLGNRSTSIPSAVFLRDELMLTGESAVRRGQTDPGGLAIQFKRRLGDPAPLIVGGAPLSAEFLFARLLRAVLDTVISRYGGPPDGIVVTHPANWGPYKLELLRQALDLADMGASTTISEPEAAAIHYAGLERVPVGALIAVYDLGGGTFDAAVLAKTAEGFEIVGRPEGIERLGGIDFDQAVITHVLNAVGQRADSASEDSRAGVDMARLREECVAAKEALGVETETTIPVSLGDLRTEVRLTRTELEAMIRVPLQQTIECLRKALANAEVGALDLSALLLVGGSSRIPLVAELVSTELGRQVSVDADPKHTVALGAARLAAIRAGVNMATPYVPVPASSPTPEPPIAVPEPSARPIAPQSPASPVSPVGAGQRAVRPRSRRGLILTLIATVVAAAAIGVAVAIAGGGGDDGNQAAGFVTACPSEELVAMCITTVEIRGGQVLAEFRTQNIEVATAQIGEGLAAVFFLATVSGDESGLSERTSSWLPWGTNSPFGGTNAAGFRGFTVEELPSDANALCVLVGRIDGAVVPETGNCAELPS